MKLSSTDLEKIADALSKMSALDVTIREAEVAGHKLVLQRRDDPRDPGNEYYVVGITSGEISGKGATR